MVSWQIVINDIGNAVTHPDINKLEKNALIEIGKSYLPISIKLKPRLLAAINQQTISSL
jgi:hypothetical protein